MAANSATATADGMVVSRISIAWPDSVSQNDTVARLRQVVALLTDNNMVLIGYVPVAANTGASSGIAMVEPSAYGTIVLELLRDDPAVLATLERWCPTA